MHQKTARRLSQVFSRSPELTINECSRLALLSDCHRGTGTWADNFLNNQNLFFAALTYYYQNDFTYIELGDGDELWENRRLDQIISIHSNAYWLMAQFQKKGRFHMLYGNHDRVKEVPAYTAAHCQSCSVLRCRGADCKSGVIRKQGAEQSIPELICHEGLILKMKETGDSLFLVHGHQGDLLNDSLWKLARFLVRYIWKPLELSGVHDPTSAARNYRKKDKVERRLAEWAKENRQPLICGHTHRPVLPKPGEGLYFNDGSCVHPRCITALEIRDGSISLIKWALKTKADRTLYVGREVLEGPYPLSAYFQA